MSILVGGAPGVGCGALVSWLLYYGLVAIPLRHLFAATGWLIALLAAGRAGPAAAILVGADYPDVGLAALGHLLGAAER